MVLCKVQLGVYKVSVFGVPSFIEKDDKWLVDPSSNWTSFDLCVEWALLDESTREVYKQVREQYTREKPSAVWSSSYSKELMEKYQKQLEEYEKEKQEHEKSVSKQDIDVASLKDLTKKYTIGSALGRGDFTTVMRAKNNSTGVEYACKIIDKNAAKEAGIDGEILRKQIDVLKMVQHKYIVALVEHFETENALCLISDIHEGGEIFRNIAEQTAPYTENHARQIVVQLLEAIDSLHDKNVIHKNIVPRNILFQSKDASQIRLVGFSLVQILKEKEDCEQGSFGGDPSFQSPEVIQQQGFGKGVDTWAIGCNTYLLLCGYRPFHDTNTMKLYSKIRQGNYEFSEADWKSVSNEGKDFVKKLLCVDPKARMSVKEALKHPWIAQKTDAVLPNVRKNLAKNEY